MTHTYRTGRHWATDAPDLHPGPVEGCAECAERRHGAAIYSTGRHGCWATCLCGWKSGLYTTSGGASIAFAEHVAEEGT